MAQIDIRCPKCGSSNLRVRSSQRMTMRTTVADLFCHSCNQCRVQVAAEITGVALANYVDSEEAMRATRPLDQADDNQLEIPTEP